MSHGDAQELFFLSLSIKASPNSLLHLLVSLSISFHSINSQTNHCKIERARQWVGMASDGKESERMKVPYR